MCKILPSSKQNKKGKISPTLHVTDLNWITMKIDWCENLIQILCFDPSVLCKCVEIFLPDDEARALTFNLSQIQTLLNDLPVPVQVLYTSDAIYLLVIVNMITGKCSASATHGIIQLHCHFYCTRWPTLRIYRINGIRYILYIVWTSKTFNFVGRKCKLLKEKKQINIPIFFYLHKKDKIQCQKFEYLSKYCDLKQIFFKKILFLNSLGKKEKKPNIEVNRKYRISEFKVFFSLRMNSLQNDNLSVSLFLAKFKMIDIMGKGKNKRKVYKMGTGATWKYCGFPQCSYKNAQVTNLARRTVTCDAGDHAKLAKPYLKFCEEFGHDTLSIPSLL